MKRVLVVGMNKTGTTIVASVIHNSIPYARLFVEPQSIGLFEKLGKVDAPWVVKILYEHWLHRPFLLKGIVRGETHFRPNKAVAIIRDPRDQLISALMYRAYNCVLEGADESQVNAWVEIVRDKEANPEKYSVVSLIGRLANIFNVGDTADSFFETFITYSSWIDQNRDDFHVLRYEDFVARNTSALSAYLGVELSTEGEVAHRYRRVARTRRSGAWRTLMLPQDVAYLRERYGAALQQQGYSDWEIRPAKPDPAEGSDYILRITGEAFKSVRQEPDQPLTLPTDQ